MITQCPHCQQQFRLTDEQVGSSQGMVRCGHCMKAFDLELSKTYSASLDESPSSSPGSPAKSGASGNPAGIPVNSARSVEAPETNIGGGNLLSEAQLRNFVLSENLRSTSRSDTEEDEKLPDSLETSIDLHSGDRIEPKLESGDLQAGDHDPCDLTEYEKGNFPQSRYRQSHYQQSHYQQSHLGTWLVYCSGIPACALLLLGLLLQLDLVAPQYTRNRVLDPICTILKCSHKENSFYIQFSDLRSHPSRKNVLIMESVIKNNSSEERPYPALHLKLINAGTQTSVERTFISNEYAPGMDSQEKIPAGKSIPVTLEIIDPATPINGYELVVRSGHGNN